MQALQEWAANRTETFPASVADALIPGENPVRVFRRHRTLSQTDLARSGGISAPYLNQIEAGKRRPSMMVLKGLASAPGIPLDVLTA